MDYNNQNPGQISPLPASQPSAPAAQPGATQPAAAPQSLPYTPAAAAAPVRQPSYTPSAAPAAPQATTPTTPPAAPVYTAPQSSAPSAPGYGSAVPAYNTTGATAPGYGASPQSLPYGSGAPAPAPQQPGVAGYTYGQAQPGSYTMPVSAPAKKPAGAKIAAIILAALLLMSVIGNIVLAPKASFADDRVYVINDTRYYHRSTCSNIEEDDILISIPHSELLDFPTLLPCPDCTPNS